MLESLHWLQYQVRNAKRRGDQRDGNGGGSRLEGQLDDLAARKPLDHVLVEYSGVGDEVRRQRLA